MTAPTDILPQRVGTERLRCPRVGLTQGVPRGAYAERSEQPPSTLDAFGRRAVAPITRRWYGRTGASVWRRRAERIEEAATRLDGLDEGALETAADTLRVDLARDGLCDDRVAQSFALVREAARRSLGMPHYEVQLRAGWVMLEGRVAEMQTGEGKTLTASLPACTAALAGLPVHVVTVNDYLAERDAKLLEPLYAMLGLSVGVVVSGMDPSARRAAYARDVTYCTNKEVAFDYLKDRIALGGHPSRRVLELEELDGRPGRRERLVHRGLHFAIVDEADSILVDEARTPLIIAERSHDPVEEQIYREAVAAARDLRSGRDFRIDETERQVQLTEEGSRTLAERLAGRGGPWSGPRRREAFVRQALTALHLFHRDQQYILAKDHEGEDRVQIVDEYTGRVMPDRSWEHGLHQMIEVKEGLEPSGSQDPRARISYQRFFRRYHRLAGMTGTAREVSAELWNDYGLAVVPIPPHRPCQRRFLGERVYATAEAKWSAVAERIADLAADGRSVLVGTRSVAASERLSERLVERGVPHRVLNARQDADEAEIVAQAGHVGRVTVATNMAGRGTDIVLGAGVAETGGLHVLATERHDASRIDRQLFGRCARQGDPGTCESMVSLEDDLALVYGGSLMPLARRVSGPLLQRLGRLALSQAQSRAGRLHARIRHQLLKADERRDVQLAFSGRPD